MIYVPGVQPSEEEAIRHVTPADTDTSSHHDVMDLPSDVTMLTSCDRQLHGDVTDDSDSGGIIERSVDNDDESAGDTSEHLPGCHGDSETPVSGRADVTINQQVRYHPFTIVHCSQPDYGIRPSISDLICTLHARLLGHLLREDLINPVKMSVHPLVGQYVRPYVHNQTQCSHKLNSGTGG